MVTQSFLFDIGVYENPDAKKKRIRTKKPSYKKVYKNDVINNTVVSDDVTLWGEMRKIYNELSNFFPLPFGYNSETFDYKNYIRVWKQQFDKQEYIYHNVRYTEVPDLFFEAEIIGTENMNINERLVIHKALLNQLKQGVSVEEFFSNSEVKIWLMNRI
jgi:hypothetical protein